MYKKMIDTTTDQNAYNQGVSQFTTGLTDLISKQNAETAATQAKYQPDITGLQTQLQGYNDQIRGIQKNLNDLPGQLTARAQGSDVNEAQRQRQVTAESTPLQTNLANLGIAQAPISDRLTTLQTNKSQEIAALSDKYAREISGYTTAGQATLNALLDKLNRQRTLSDIEMAQAYDLAKQERSFEQAKELAAQQFKYDTAKAAATTVVNPYLTPSNTTTAATGGYQDIASLTKELQDGFRQGSSAWAGKDEAIIASIMTEGGLSKQQATDLYYNTRRPFEKTNRVSGGGW